MQLTSENYYSQEANKEYMSVSGYKGFAGTYGKIDVYKRQHLPAFECAWLCTGGKHL